MSGEITHHQACDELYEVILSLVQRSKRPSKPS
nr:hypothetical protein XAC3615_6360001 [Xanthomonas citri pv. citri]